MLSIRLHDHWNHHSFHQFHQVSALRRAKSFGVSRSRGCKTPKPEPRRLIFYEEERSASSIRFSPSGASLPFVPVSAAAAAAASTPVPCSMLGQWLRKKDCRYCPADCLLDSNFSPMPYIFSCRQVVGGGRAEKERV
jgi:hypothetical protein